MYMGLMKRGLFIMFSFFSCCYLAASVFFRVFTFGFIIIWFFSVFDAYNCRKRIENNKNFYDDIDDIKRFLIKHRLIIIAVFGIVALVEIVRSHVVIENVDFWGGKEAVGRLVFDNILVFFLICIGLYCLFFKKRK